MLRLVFYVNWGTNMTNGAEEKRRLEDKIGELTLRNKELKRQLNRNKELLNSLLNSQPNMVWIANESCQGTFVNKSWLEFTGSSLSECLGTGWQNNIHPEDLNGYLKEYTEAFNKREKFEQECRIKNSRGEYRWVQGIGNPLIAPDGEFLGYVGSCIDVTDKKNAEKELENSEKFLDKIFKSAQDGVFFLDAEQKYKGFFGCNVVSGFLIGKTDEDIFDSENVLIHKQANERALSGEEITYEWKIKVNNDAKYYRTSLSPVFDSNGSVMGIAGVRCDITDYKKTQELLNQSKKYVENIIETADTMIIAMDNDGIIKLFNKASEDITGYHRREIIGKNCYDVLVPRDKYSYVWGYFRDWKEKGIPMPGMRKSDSEVREEHENPIVTKYGEERCIVWRDSEIIEDGKPIGIISFGVDITERKKMEELRRVSEENKRLLNEAREYDKLKTEFFANISHELRTPINVILGSIQLLQMIPQECIEEKVSGKLDKYVGYMKQNCYRLVRLVNNLIDATKIDAGYYDINLKNCDIVSIIEDITLSISMYANNKGISLTFDTDVEEKIMACDPDKIERIILNLLSNAIKFTRTEGSICVNIQDDNDNIIISIKDTGIGIPENKLDFIFERFRQVNKTLIRDNEGSGIGLSLVKSLIELHDGRIYVDSKLGEGSEFVIKLPVRVVSDDNNSHQKESDFLVESNIERVNIEFSDIYS
jgi:PAS domain S-box-containing protein